MIHSEHTDFDIVSWGEKYFGLVNDGTITMEYLIESIPENIGDNSFSVLGCFCENNESQTYLLQQENIYRNAKEYLSDYASFPNDGMARLYGHVVVKLLENGMSYDNHFNTEDKHINMTWEVIVSVWRNKLDVLHTAVTESLKMRSKFNSEFSERVSRIINIKNK